MFGVLHAVAIWDYRYQMSYQKMIVLAIHQDHVSIHHRQAYESTDDVNHQNVARTFWHADSGQGRVCTGLTRCGTSFPIESECLLTTDFVLERPWRPVNSHLICC